MSTSRKMGSPASLDGTSECIKKWLCERTKLPAADMGTGDQKLVSDGAALHLSEWECELKLPALLNELYVKIEANWCNAGCRRGGAAKGETKNWDWEIKPRIDPSNNSPEVRLERTLAKMLKEEGAEGRWANHIPIASGLCHPRTEHSRNIDMANSVEGLRSLIELKIGTSNPADAAFQFVRYGLLLKLAREQQPKIRMRDERWSGGLLWLKVFAPHSFYKRYKLGWFAKQMSAALVKTGTTAGFSFHAFPDNWKPKTEADVLRYLNGVDGNPQ